MLLCYIRYKPSSVYFAESRIEIEAVNDAPQVQLPGQVYRRNFSVVWPDIEEAEVAFTRPLFTDEDTTLDVPSVSISGKKTDSRQPKDHARTSTYCYISSLATFAVCTIPWAEQLQSVTPRVYGGCSTYW